MDEAYEGREQTAAKHLMLRQYLEKLAYKVGFHRGTLNYIDGFAGPWESNTLDLSDTSPFIALDTLTRARKQLVTHRKPVAIRAFFVSPVVRGAQQLQALRSSFPEAHIEIVRKTFEEALGDASAFATQGKSPFTFTFIDHTGWKGFGLREMEPLLRVPHSEVLINFMTGFIRRFIDNEDEAYRSSFVDLFGDSSYRDAWRGLEGLDREDRIVQAYCSRIASAGRYNHCVSSVILNPKRDSTHFHLVYGTRSDEGLATFRAIEQQALQFQRRERADTQQRARIERTGQHELFVAHKVLARSYEDELRARHLERANALLDQAAQGSAGVRWDELVLAALQIPMVSEKDVKAWLDRERKAGRVEVLGLGAKEKVPKRKGGHRVRRVARGHH